MMLPSTVAIPEMHLAVLAGVFHPVGLAGMLAGLVALVAGGLCVAMAIQGRRSVDRARRVLDIASRASEREGVAAA
jgi:hypothetical protein